MKYRTAKRQWNIFSTRFVPYEDVMGMAHEGGYSSILVPGSGLATFDSYEANPFETSKQRRERTVHGLLQKLDPATISLQVASIGHVDEEGGADGLRAKEEREEEERQIELLRQQDKKKAKKKARGGSKIGNRMRASERQMQEAAREKNKLVYMQTAQKEKKEKETVDADLQFMLKHEKKFNPVDQMFDKGGNLKRQKTDDD